MKEKNNTSTLYKSLSLAAATALALMPLVSLAQQDKNFWKPDFTNNSRQARVCNKDNGNSDTAFCDARVVTDTSGSAKNFVAPSGYGPLQLRAAYSVTGTGGGHRIIAIVDAYDDPNIQSDLNVYSAQFGIPALPSCSGAIANSAVPCFKKVDQNGGTHYPTVNSGWDLEIALDVEASHALCQDCSVLLVEASTSSFNNLAAAVDTAANLGAKIISNSYGGSEFSTETSVDFHFNKPGVAITVSSGDSGFGTQYPASSRYVTAVGGTTLTMNGLSYAGESAWSGSGSGCSVYEQKPTWQHDTACTRRTVADVSADADPATGAAVYDSVRYQGVSGWFQVGGTSLASPIVAAIYALSNNTAGTASSIPYSHTTNLHDVITGSNGTCSGSYLCTAKAGYDGPTGLGTPNGIAGF